MKNNLAFKFIQLRRIVEDVAKIKGKSVTELKMKHTELFKKNSCRSVTGTLTMFKFVLVSILLEAIFSYL